MFPLTFLKLNNVVTTSLQNNSLNHKIYSKGDQGVEIKKYIYLLSPVTLWEAPHKRQTFRTTFCSM